MTNKYKKSTQKTDEAKMEIQAILEDLSEQIENILALKDEEIKIDHTNDIKSQQVLKLLRQIKRECTEERISAYAHIGETILCEQIEEDIDDDKPWAEGRKLIVGLNIKLGRAIEIARKIK